MRIPRKVALLGATAAALALIPVSSASAYSASERKAEKKQNDRIKKLSKDLSTAKNQLRTFNTSFATQAASLTGLNTRLAVIEGAAPQLIKGLTDLGDAAKQLQTGLGQLKTGLETAGAGLTSLKSLATSYEYGIGQVIIGATPAAGSFVVTPDIPDSAQQASVTQQFVAGAGGAISLQVGVRSAESDGTGASSPAAHCRVTIVDDAGAFVTSSPNAAFNNLPFYPINTKSTLTSTDAANVGFPFGPKTNGADADTLVNLTDVGTNASGGATATAGQEYTVTLTCVDTTPSADDPTA